MELYEPMRPGVAEIHSQESQENVYEQFNNLSNITTSDFIWLLFQWVGEILYNSTFIEEIDTRKPVFIRKKMT